MLDKCCQAFRAEFYRGIAPGKLADIAVIPDFDNIKLKM